MRLCMSCVCFVCVRVYVCFVSVLPWVCSAVLCPKRDKCSMHVCDCFEKRRPFLANGSVKAFVFIGDRYPGKYSNS